jgi:hypothetical protein
MRTIHGRGYVVALVGLFLPTLAQAQPHLAQTEFMQIREAANLLVHHVEELMDDIRDELGGDKERHLYHHGTQVLRASVEFQRSLRPEINRAQMVREFEEMDRHVHRLLEEIQRLPRVSSEMQRRAARLRGADEQLHFALFKSDNAPDRRREALIRQAHAFHEESRELANWARYTLANNPRSRQFQEAMERVVSEAQHLHQVAHRGAELDHLKRDFADLDRSWSRALQEFKDLRPREEYVLIRAVEQLDQIHDHLQHLLGFENRRPRFKLP